MNLFSGPLTFRACAETPMNSACGNLRARVSRVRSEKNFMQPAIKGRKTAPLLSTIHLLARQKAGVADVQSCVTRWRAFIQAGNFMPAD